MEEKKGFRENTFLRILFSGAIATIAQRSLNLEAFSLEGFVFFLLIFSTVSYFWIYIFPNKMVLTKEQLEEKEKNRKLNNEIFKEYFKKAFILISSIIILNSLINLLSFKLGLFDDDFKYRYETKSAISLSINTEPIVVFQSNRKFYFLYKKDENYYLVSKKDEKIKNYILTLYSEINMYEIYNSLKSNEMFLDILKNISPTVYEEVDFIDFIFKPLWFSNSTKDIYWTRDDFEEYKRRYESYIKRQ
jgi:hypothetical protein